MKKTLLLLILLSLTFTSSAQQIQVNNGLKAYSPPETITEETLGQINDTFIPSAKPEKPEALAGERNPVAVITIGAAANAYGLSGKPRTVLWANSNLSSITFVHRMTNPPGSGHLAYGLSTDGGWNWTNNIQVFTPPPQTSLPLGAIYNPPGNTNPGEAYFTYLTPTSAGNYAAGVHKLDQTQNPTQNTWSGYYSTNNAFTINPFNGNVLAVAAATAGFTYLDNLVISRGIFNPAINDIEYSQSLIPFPAHPQAYPGSPVDVRIAFAPDGLTGYISVIWDNLLDPHAGGNAFYPVLIKTTDGGNTWGEPEPVIMAGPDGFDEVKYYLSNEQLEEIFELPLPHRDSIIYTTAYEHGLAVDLNGNPHICVTVGVANANPYGIYAGYDGFTATFHFYVPNQEQNFVARMVAPNKTFRGTFVAISQDNRSQASVTQDGSKIFLSWVDTHFEGVTENIMPDIFCNAFDVTTRRYTDVYNVTYLSEAWLEAYMGTASYYVFENESGYVIPFVYQTIPGGIPINPVDYKYIADFTLTENNFTFCSFIPGDVNCDGLVNVNDVVRMVNFVIGAGGGGIPFIYENADVNGDGIINVADILLVINIILGI